MPFGVSSTVVIRPAARRPCVLRFRLPSRLRTVWLSLAFVCSLISLAPQAMVRAGDAQVIATFRSRNFELRTDLSAEEAGELLQRLETMLGFVADYWGRPHRGVISMYVARDIGAWPPEELATMDPAGITAIRSGGGLTVGTVMVRGNAF